MFLSKQRLAFEKMISDDDRDIDIESDVRILSDKFDRCLSFLISDRSTDFTSLIYFRQKTILIPGLMQEIA